MMSMVLTRNNNFSEDKCDTVEELQEEIELLKQNEERMRAEVVTFITHVFLFFFS